MWLILASVLAAAFSAGGLWMASREIKADPSQEREQKSPPTP